MLREILADEDEHHTGSQHVRDARKRMRVDPSDIIIMTAYMADKRMVEAALHSPEFDDLPGQPGRRIRVGTIDAFQGMEARFVILLLSVTADTGPCFVANPRRLYVATTRGIECLLIVGDAGMVNTAKGHSIEMTAYDDGARGYVNPTKLREFMGYLFEHGLVATVRAAN